MQNITTCFVETLRSYIKKHFLEISTQQYANFLCCEALMRQIHLINVIGKTGCY